MRILGLQAQIRKKRPNWIRVKPHFTAQNILNRNFEAKKLNQKWFTDI